MRWSCERDCGFEGSKTYAERAEAARYATAFDREDADSSAAARRSRCCRCVWRAAAAAR